MRVPGGGRKPLGSGKGYFHISTSNLALIQFRAREEKAEIRAVQADPRFSWTLTLFPETCADICLPPFTIPMKILFTPTPGLIWSNLIFLPFHNTAIRLLKKLHKPHYAGNLTSLADCSENLRYSFTQADLVDAEAVREAIFAYQPDAIMHLAAESHVDRSIDGPGEFIQTNVVGTYNLLQAALAYWRRLGDAENTGGPSRQAAFRFLHVSTDEVYGSLGSADPAFSETTRYDPHSPYSASKAASDHLVRAWHSTYGLPTLVTNCSNNYGPFQFPEKLIPVVILKCLRGEPIPVYGKGENIRDWLYVEDHADALYTVLTRGRVGETYNIGGCTERRNIDLVRMICRLMAEELGGDQSDLGRASENRSFEDLITYVTDRPRA